MLFILFFPVWLIIAIAVSTVTHFYTRRIWLISLWNAAGITILYIGFMLFIVGQASWSEIRFRFISPVFMGIAIPSFVVSVVIGLVYLSLRIRQRNIANDEIENDSPNK